ncbi:FIST N-terminal domain-containing protein [Xanthobacter sp. AM11]|uniref:FIST N-terminal domain-containing protein n=1 Tax=Xanthobacter sp. AM11 TaxID=3380643 RepID=UPI0039BEEF4C
MLRLSAHANATAGNGIVTVAQAEADIDGFAAMVRAAAAEREFSAMLVFFSSSLDAASLAATLKREVDIPMQAGCSTAGEIGPFGMSDGGVVALLFPAEKFRCLAGLVTQISRHGFERGIACAQMLKERCAALIGSEMAHSAFAVTLIDGLSNCEEVMVSAFQVELRDIPQVGGSAGDGLAFRETWIIHDGAAYTDAALLCLFHSALPFRIFKSDHYEPTDVRLVVTECDQERRVVTEINGAPAGEEYAQVTGLDAGTLSPMSFASHPLMVKIGGDYFCRSIRRVERQGLSFFCAIDNGVVLTLARRRDIAESIDSALGRLEAEMGGIDVVLGFDCVLRRVEAEDRQLSHRVAELYRHYHVVGFSTYGEQYKAMHINQTFTGIAFGRAAAGQHAWPTP